MVLFCVKVRHYFKLDKTPTLRYRPSVHTFIANRWQIRGQIDYVKFQNFYFVCVGLREKHNTAVQVCSLYVCYVLQDHK